MAEAVPVIFLAGAPEAHSLDWDDNTHLTDYFTAPVRRFLGNAVDQDDTTYLSPTHASFPLPKWRVVQLPKSQNPHTIDASRPTSARREKPQFLSFDHDSESQHEQFLEYSLAVLDHLESSQIYKGDETFLDETTVLTSASFSTNASTETSLHRSDIASSTGSDAQQVITFTGPLADLKRVPNANHLKSIYPQTMTINIIAGVIAVQASRAVRVRRTGAEMEIIEVLVGDETRAGFTISFWLTPVDSQRSNQSHANDGLRAKLGALRSGHLVLITHVALSEFQGNVYGQSLSRRITRNNTSLIRLSDNVAGLSGPVVAKLERVKEWSTNFLGTGTRAGDSPDLARSPKSKERRNEDDLPPDTQF